MTPIFVSSLAFCSIFLGALGGVWIARRLPAPHLTTETRTAISVSMAVVGTLAALVLSHMLSNAGASFTLRTKAVQTLAVDLIKLDRALQRYGSETAGIREDIHVYARAKVAELSTTASDGGVGLENLHRLESISDRIVDLHPTDERAHRVQAQALRLVDEMTDARWLLVERNSLAVPLPFLVLMIFWLSLLFASFGLFAPRNTTVIAALLLCALAISGGILMILELGAPTRGFIRPSVAPMATAVEELARE
ncbi:bestrophin-like domain [Methylobacterium flocculans]|uniref:bestrophin-like domain n=1 Tax=Methylobacterium flocculans TaxID=2984843 RepID=UPI0021F2A5C0|nr:hypothetical protein [Methylobacterium sp. FF17]